MCLWLFCGVERRDPTTLAEFGRLLLAFLGTDNDARKHVSACVACTCAKELTAPFTQAEKAFMESKAANPAMVRHTALQL